MRTHVGKAIASSAMQLLESQDQIPATAFVQKSVSLSRTSLDPTVLCVVCVCKLQCWGIMQSAHDDSCLLRFLLLRHHAPAADIEVI